MENASKALIIAGAILLSILIIALGIYVFNMAKGATNTNALDELEVRNFNSEFTNYSGKVIGTGVTALLDKVISNATLNKDAADRLPNIIYNFNVDKTNTTTTELVSSADANNANGANVAGISADVRAKIAARHYYWVDYAYDDTTGLIKAIIIVYNEEQMASAREAAAAVKVD